MACKRAELAVRLASQTCSVASIAKDNIGAVCVQLSLSWGRESVAVRDVENHEA